MTHVTPSPHRHGVRYVNIQVAIPNDSPFTSPDNVLSIIDPHWRQRSHVKSIAQDCPSWAALAGAPRQHHLANSNCTFIPLVSQDERISLGLPINSPPSSPFLKPSPTLSILSTNTAETVDTSATITPSPCTVPPGYGSTPLKDTSICRVLDKSFGSSSPSFRSSPDDKKKAPWASQALKEEDPVRKSRIKTELCMHYVNGTQCPFGANCTYAHGEEELQMTKLIDLHRAGLVDIETYRTKPCLTWVSTGSCPFGKRCTGMHDPRVAGMYPSWLPHTETQGNTIATDINVDALHQKRLQTILQGNPFGNDFSLDMDGFSDLYKLICNTAILKRRRNTLSELHKLQIALKMRGGPGFNYKFRPQHIIYDELCMVLQKRAFRLTDNDAIEIPLNSYNAKQSTHVLCREIAFGPDSDPAVRGPSLWFNIMERDVTICTPQQAKRYRWKKAPTPNTKKNDEVKKCSVFESRECIVMIRPLDNDAFQLTTDILRHRMEVLKTERLASLRDRFDSLKALELEKVRLEEVFRNQRLHWVTWMWPVSLGRDEVDETTPVPPVESHYVPRIKEASEGMVGSAVAPIWNSFASTISAESTKGNIIHNAPRRRLAIFKHLATGKPISRNKYIPHIIKDRIDFACQSTESSHRQSEQCWRALLLSQDGFHQKNEWGIVRLHFENSRSKKVLSILQQ